MRTIIIILAFLSSQLLADTFELAKFKNIKEIYHDDDAVTYIENRIGNSKTFDNELIYEYFMKEHASKKGKITEEEEITSGELCFQGGCDGFIQFTAKEPIIIITYIDQIYVFFKEELSNKAMEKVIDFSKSKMGSNTYRKDKTVMEIKFINQ